jgi:hypothetical protein
MISPSTQKKRLRSADFTWAKATITFPIMWWNPLLGLHLKSWIKQTLWVKKQSSPLNRRRISFTMKTFHSSSKCKISKKTWEICRMKIKSLGNISEYWSTIADKITTQTQGGPIIFKVNLITLPSYTREWLRKWKGLVRSLIWLPIKIRFWETFRTKAQMTMRFQSYRTK